MSVSWLQGLNLIQGENVMSRVTHGARPRPVSLAQMKIESPKKENNEDAQGCEDQFNPQSEQDTKDVVDNWTGAYLELAQLVAARRSGGKTAAASRSPSAATPNPSPDADEEAALAEQHRPAACESSHAAADPSWAAQEPVMGTAERASSWPPSPDS